MKPLFVRELSDRERHALRAGLRSSDGFRVRRCHILFSTHAAQISGLTEQVSTIEGETDDLHDAARSRLFEVKGPAGALHFWVSSEILDHLERVMDRLEDVANEIHGTMIEHV